MIRRTSSTLLRVSVTVGVKFHVPAPSLLPSPSLSHCRPERPSVSHGRDYLKKKTPFTLNCLKTKRDMLDAQRTVECCIWQRTTTEIALSSRLRETRGVLNLQGVLDRARVDVAKPPYTLRTSGGRNKPAPHWCTTSKKTGPPSNERSSLTFVGAVKLPRNADERCWSHG